VRIIIACPESNSPLRGRIHLRGLSFAELQPLAVRRRTIHLSVMAFHEKAGRSQGNSGFIASFLFFVAEKKFSSPSSRCRHASIRTLEERIVSLGACGAFSIQPVLPSVWRPIVALKSGTWPRPLTQSPELGFGFCLFSSLERFGFCFRFFKRLP